MSEKPLIQGPGPYASIESIHILLRCIELSADEKLFDLIDARAVYDAQTPERQAELLTQQGVTSEDIETRYQEVLERRVASATKAASIALRHYEVYMDEIHEQANFINDRLFS